MVNKHKIIFLFQSIVRTYNSETKTSVVLLRGFSVVNELAFDWLGDNLYLTDKAAPSLVVCSLRNKQSKQKACKTLFHEEVTDLVLFPQRRYKSENVSLYQSVGNEMLAA